MNNPANYVPKIDCHSMNYQIMENSLRKIRKIARGELSETNLVEAIHALNKIAREASFALGLDNE